MTVTIDDVISAYPPAANLDATKVTAMISFVEGFLPEIISVCAYSTTLTDAITRYMVAHYLSVGYDQGGLISKTTGESKETYRELSSETEGLASTIYGQQALSLDIGGCLGRMAASVVKAQFRVV